MIKYSNMPKKKDLDQENNNKETLVNDDILNDEISLGDLGLDLNDDDSLISIEEETITIITDDDESLLEDEEFLLGLDKKRHKKNTDDEDGDIEDFDNYFYQEE